MNQCAISISLFHKSGFFIFVRLEVASEGQSLCVRNVVSVVALCVEVQLIQKTTCECYWFLIMLDSLGIKSRALCVVQPECSMLRCYLHLRKRYCCQISVLTSGIASWLDWKDFTTRTRSSGTHLADDSKPLCGKFGLAHSIKRQMKNTGGLSRHTMISATLTRQRKKKKARQLSAFNISVLCAFVLFMLPSYFLVFLNLNLVQEVSHAPVPELL